ncbi:lipase 1 [Paractinoplanes abujensis]|uniref:Lysophospholipase L1-like esterase n=1 Tax=Paractinoplanes abujensis TaxID=882441 RepID=A0A7W7D0G6_9ACTN|nr:SGNH/GDSL hydrolase family protein [Actinoplanes abujensis]MBB4698040.1 lysophospholipase L1-like esterase [Actinoplanes abujensis]GID19475.1 lipase 1 [Actinoplanes abujensis]
MGRRLSLLACLVVTTLLTFTLAAPARAASSIDYVALGDSYSSGVGAPGQSILCFRSAQGYPGQWAARNQPQSFTDLSCGGAETSDVRNLQVPFLSRSADLISITIGGNDAGFASTVLGCQTGTDAACAAKVNSARTDITSTLPAKLDATYAAIKRKAPGARVIVLGYPALFDTSSASCGIIGMSLAKRRSLNEGAQVLNEVIAARAAAAGLTFSDVRDEFAGHGICSANPYLHGLTVVPPQNSFHPNLAGYTNGYLPALVSAL